MTGRLEVEGGAVCGPSMAQSIKDELGCAGYDVCGPSMLARGDGGGDEVVSGRVDEVCCDTARQDEGGGDGGGDNDVFYESRVSEARPRINVSWVSVQHGEGRVQLYYIQQKMLGPGPELKTRRIRG